MRLALILLAACLFSCAKKPVQKTSDWVTITFADKTSWIAVREIGFMDTDGNHVKPVAATASGVYADMRELPAWGGIEAVLDEKPETSWNSGAYRATVQFQFPDKKPAFAEIAMFPENLASTRIETTGFDTDGSGVRFLVRSAAVADAFADAARLAGSRGAQR